MRAHRRLLALPLMALVASVPVLPLACVSNNNPIGPTIGEDSGGGGASDSGGMVGADGQVSPTDSAASDSAISTPSEAAADGPPSGTDSGTAPDSSDGAVSGPVTVTVVTPLGPESGVLVVFESAAGDVITSATTGVTGSVTETVAAGSQITAVMGTLANASLVTIVAVEPGDMLTVLDLSGYDPNNTIESVNIASLPTGAPSETSDYRVYAGSSCFTGSSSTFPLVMNLESGCVTPAGAFPVLAIADGPIGDADGALGELAFLFQNGNTAYPDDGGVPDGDVLGLSLSGTWTPSGAQTVSAANTLAASVNGGTLVFSEVAGGVPYTQSSALLLAEDGGVVTQTFPAHPGYADFDQSEAHFDVINQAVGGNYPNWQSSVAIATRTAAGTPASLDLSQLLPTVVAAGIGYVDPTHPTVSWATSAPVTSADAAIAVIVWYGGGTGESQGGSWTIVAPPGIGVVQVPNLPPGNVMGPSSLAEYQNTPPVALLEASFWSGYPQARAAVATMPGLLDINGYFELAVVPPLPVAGTLSVSLLLPEEE